MPPSADHLSHLFRSGRPIFRPVNLIEDPGEISDVECLWRSYQHEPYLYFGRGLSRPNFARTLELMSGRITIWVAQYNPAAISKPPLFAVVTLQDDGWRVEPHTHYLPWRHLKISLCRPPLAIVSFIRMPKQRTCLIAARGGCSNPLGPSTAKRHGRKSMSISLGVRSLRWPIHQSRKH